MAEVVDVAAYILGKEGPMTAWKLQKLVYYCQAWSLVWEEAPLFEDRIEAWANGPVTRTLYEVHKGNFKLKRLHDQKGEVIGDPNALIASEKETVDIVLRDYGERSAQWLSDLTHMERPWQAARARGRVGPGDRCDEEIRHDEMAEYYGGLLAAQEARTMAEDGP